MFDILLYQPQIPPNTGNIIRLCANSDARLHLIGELGFSLEEKALRRAGLDYHDLAEVHHWPDLQHYLSAHPHITSGENHIWAITKFGKNRYDSVTFRRGDALLFGSEQHGLPQTIKDDLGDNQQLFLPMRSGSRSLNLSNAVAITLYEAWRQHDFSSSAEYSSIDSPA